MTAVSPECRPDGSGPDIEAAASLVRERIAPRSPRVLLVLGSGLGGFSGELDEPAAVSFDEVAGLPSAGVKGHAGRWVAGRLEGREVLVQEGRFHVYEGYPMEVVAAPVRIAAALGVRTLLLTNAAGGIHRDLVPGSLMLLDDHLNLMWRSPLVGPVREGEERFPDMSAPYDPALQRIALEAAASEGVRLLRGTYGAVPGPSYETPAEIRMLERMGADAVGMSTVPEMIAARAAGLGCLALSLVTNRAAGLSLEPLSHHEVVEVGREAAGRVRAVVRRILRELPDRG